MFIAIFSGCTNDKEQPANATVDTPPYSTEPSTSFEQETSSLPEGVACILDDGSYLYISDLMFPVETYNYICSTGDASDFNLVFPESVLMEMLKTHEIEDYSGYAAYLNELYKSVYNDNYTMKNEFVSCELLDESALEDFSEYYLENFNEQILPEYGCIIESNYSITYTNEEGEEQSDFDTDYFIAYLYNNTVYLDYFFIDTIDL